MARILVDDELQIRRLLRIALEAEGHDVTEASTGRDGTGRAATASPDVVLLDPCQPDRDGKDVLREIRAWSDVPVLVLSVRADEGEKVEALALDAPARIEMGGLVLDAAEHSFRLDRRRNTRTPMVSDLLWLLASHTRRLVTQTIALETVWGPAHVEDSRYLRVFIPQLRAKLGDEAAGPVRIFTERGIGYRVRDA